MSSLSPTWRAEQRSSRPDEQELDVLRHSADVPAENTPEGTRPTSPLSEGHQHAAVSSETEARPPSYTARHEPTEKYRLPRPRDTLTGSRRGLVLAFLWSAFAVTSWALLCFLVYHPINNHNIFYSNAGAYDFESYNAQITSPSPKTWPGSVTQTERAIRAAKILNAIAIVTAVPVACAICSLAAASYSTYQISTFSLRRLTVLGDHGWIDPRIWKHISRSQGRSRLGSRLLYFAIALNLLGLLIFPVQQGVLSQQAVKLPTLSFNTTNIASIGSLLAQSPNQGDQSPVNNQNLLLQGALEIAQNSIYSQNLWFPPSANNAPSIPLYRMWQNDSIMNEAFVAAIANDQNTGLVRQFIPRINSSLSYDVIDESEFPQNCDAINGAFYAAYSGSIPPSEGDGYAFQACMPVNVAQSPYVSTANRQDFSEVLYLNVSQTTYQNASGTIRITVNTTVGYFELPNHLNGYQYGPLLDTVSSSLCDSTCIPEGDWTNPSSTKAVNALSTVKLRRQAPNGANVSSTGSGTSIDDTSINNSTISISESPNKGPLTMLATALFGNTSYIARRNQALLVPWSEATDPSPYSQECAGLQPLNGLSAAWGDNAGADCYYLVDASQLLFEISLWLQNFVPSGQEDLGGSPAFEVTPTLRAAIYAAEYLWLTGSDNTNPMLSSSSGLTVSSDVGVDLIAPFISLAGIIVVSVLLGAFIIGLMSFAIYARVVPSWTDSLDSWALLRLGSAVRHANRGTSDADEGGIPLLTTNDDLLDISPGWVGDATPHASKGILVLGGHPVARGRTFMISGGNDSAPLPPDYDQDENRLHQHGQSASRRSSHTGSVIEIPAQ